MIIDGGSCVNIASERLVKKLALLIIVHPRPYRLQWPSEKGKLVMDRQVEVMFILGGYGEDQGNPSAYGRCGRPKNTKKTLKYLSLWARNIAHLDFVQDVGSAIKHKLAYSSSSFEDDKSRSSQDQLRCSRIHHKKTRPRPTPSRPRLTPSRLDQIRPGFTA
ncbi:hypothetical protein CR513_54371, partial [Mucuna pruriens]